MGGTWYKSCFFVQVSSIRCDASCSFLCGLNSSSFTSMEKGVVTEEYRTPRHAYLPTTINAKTLQIRSHPNETWWLDPRRQATYCQWGWQKRGNARPKQALVGDSNGGSPSQTRYWAEMPGKCKSCSWMDT
jgi:hypothetical protein